MRFACPCCGYRTLGERPGSVRQLCDVCAWDSELGDAVWNESPDLADAQRTFREAGVWDVTLKAFTRAQRRDEARPAWWTSIDDGQLVIELVEGAFADVGLDGGVSFAEAELIDDYVLPSRTEHDPPPHGHGRGPRWQELTIDDLDRYHWGNFAFQDARGIRYHLPACMRAHLAGPKVPGAVESLLFMLDSGHQVEALHRLLSEPQRHAVARYLAFLATTTRDHANTATHALRKRWAAHLDDDHRAHLC